MEADYCPVDGIGCGTRISGQEEECEGGHSQVREREARGGPGGEEGERGGEEETEGCCGQVPVYGGGGQVQERGQESQGHKTGGQEVGGVDPLNPPKGPQQAITAHLQGRSFSLGFIEITC